jgi:hypothetical protein
MRCALFHSRDNGRPPNQAVSTACAEIDRRRELAIGVNPAYSQKSYHEVPYRDDWMPAFAGTTIAVTRSMHKNLAATMRLAHDAFSHTTII